MSPSAQLTYRDYAALPADGRRYEIHDGELSVTPAPNPRHQRAIGKLFMILEAHVTTHRRGEVFLSPIDVILNDTTVVQPDLVYLDASRQGQVSDRGIEGPPTLVIEVVSPSTKLIDRSRKHQLYARHGVPFYWLIDPDAGSVEACELGSSGYTRAVSATGADPVSPPPFSGLALSPDAL